MALFGAHQVFCGPFTAGRSGLRHREPVSISLKAQDGKDSLDDTVPAWRAGLAGRKGALGILGGIGLVILYLFTKDPETRYLKLCVRSKQFEKDFFNDPKKAEWAKSKGYKALQDPDCKEWPEFWERIKPF
eukprot:s309_g16.t1